MLKIEHVLSLVHGKSAHSVYRGGVSHGAHTAPSTAMDTLQDPEPTAPGGSAAGVGVFASGAAASSKRVSVDFILRPTEDAAGLDAGVVDADAPSVRAPADASPDLE